MAQEVSVSGYNPGIVLVTVLKVAPESGKKSKLTVKLSTYEGLVMLLIDRYNEELEGMAVVHRKLI
jgi:hypothetical protein